jgi:hypothetical protein
MSLPTNFFIGRGGGSFDYGVSHQPIFGENQTSSSGAPITLGTKDISLYTPPNWTGHLGEIRWNATGTIVTIAGYSQSVTRTYGCSTPWDITTANSGTHHGGFSIDTIFNYSRDGQYVVRGDRTNIYGHQLNTAYAPYGGYSGMGSLNPSSGNVQGAGFNEDGSKLWVYQRSQDRLKVYTLSTPYNLNTASLVASTNSFYPKNDGTDGNGYGIVFSGDGMGLCIVDMDDGNLHFWRFNSPYAVSNLHSYQTVTLGVGTSIMGLAIIRTSATDGYLYIGESYSSGQISRWQITFN